MGQFLQGGLNALQPKPPGHRRPKLNEKQTKQLCKFIDESAQSDNGGRLISLDIQAYIQEQFGVAYSSNHIYKILKKLGYSWITSRSKHPKQSQAVQDAFKKILHGNDS